MDTALVIMAAGIGSRFGGGVKQLAAVDDFGHVIMDYSIHDAIKAGFTKIVFIIRRNIEQDFRSVIGDRIEKICKKNNVSLEYAYQAKDDIPDGFDVPEGREKPWGTGHAVLSAKAAINMPFAVINADDYYGKKAFKIINEYLSDIQKSDGPGFCMAGFILKNTLSDNGGVTRGVCRVDSNLMLVDVKETSNIQRVVRNGISVVDADGISIDPETYVSMNMWGFSSDFIDMLEKGFIEFFENKVPSAPLKAEYLLPIYISEMLSENKITVKVLPTDDEWFGVTYKEDKDAVTEKIRTLIRNGIYNEDLYSDL